MKKSFIFIGLMVVLSVSGILITAFGTASTPFSDVPADAYYAQAAERMAARGILSGYGDDENRFGGEDTVTRAQIATLVCKILGKVEEAQKLAGETAFGDVSATHWSAGYVNYAVANGIINGDGDGNFRPDDSVKYEEVVKVIVCALHPDQSFTMDPADWSAVFLAAAEKDGLLKNLIGKKGEPMLRSDIAVITDAAVSALDSATEEGAETGGADPSVTETPVDTKTPSKDPKPAETTAEEDVTPPATEDVVQTTPADEAEEPAEDDGEYVFDEDETEPF